VRVPKFRTAPLGDTRERMSPVYAAAFALAGALALENSIVPSSTLP